MDGKLCSLIVRDEQMVRICLYVEVCVAPSMIVGARLMACSGDITQYGSTVYMCVCIVCMYVL